MTSLYHFSGLEDTYHDNLSTESVAANLRSISYNMMAWSGGDAEKFREWADFLLPLARNLVTIEGYTEQDIRKNYQQRIRQNAFLSAGQDVFPLITQWLSEQPDITDSEKIILSAWATDTLSAQEAQNIVNMTVDALKSNSYANSEKLERVFGVYRNAIIGESAFNQFASDKILTNEDYAVALKAAVSANNHSFVSRLLDTSFDADVLADVFEIATAQNRGETLNVLVDKLCLSSGGSQNDEKTSNESELFSEIAYNFIINDKHAALANLLHSARRHNLKLDIGNGFSYIDENKSKIVYHQVLSYIQGTNQTKDIARLDLRHLLNAASKFGDSEGVGYLTPYFSTHDITAALVDTAIRGSNRDGAKALLEKIAERGYPIDLTCPIEKACEFNNLEILDEILNFATKNHIKVSFDKVYSYIETPRQTLTIDASNLGTTEEKMQKITDALGAEGKIADIRDRVIARLALEEMQQLQFQPQSPPTFTPEQQQQAAVAITGEWGEINWGDQRLRFPIGLAPAVESFLKTAGLKDEDYILRPDELLLHKATQNFTVLQRAITTYLETGASGTSLAS